MAEYDQTPQGISTEGGVPSLWITMLGAPTLWLIQLETNYAFVPWACSHRGNKSILHAISVAFLILTLANGLLAWRGWQTAQRGWPSSDDEGMPAVRRFMTIIGLLSAALFSLLVIANAFPAFFLDPCQD